VTVILKSWCHGWRITCPVCGCRLQDVEGGEVIPPSDAFEHIWDEARNGEYRTYLCRFASSDHRREAIL